MNLSKRNFPIWKTLSNIKQQKRRQSFINESRLFLRFQFGQISSINLVIGNCGYFLFHSPMLITLSSSIILNKFSVSLARAR